MKYNTMFNVSHFYSIRQFLEANFSEFDYNEQVFITMKKKRGYPRFFDHVSCKILAEK